MYPTTSTEQPQPSCPTQPLTYTDHIRNSEDADLDIGDASENAEDNEKCSDNDDDSEDEDCQHPSTNLLNTTDEDEDRIHKVFEAILEPLHKDILKINKCLTTQN
jgi:hypothetical protein